MIFINNRISTMIGTNASPNPASPCS